MRMKALQGLEVECSLSNHCISVCPQRCDGDRSEGKILAAFGENQWQKKSQKLQSLAPKHANDS